jgi:hypothetical protein
MGMYQGTHTSWPPCCCGPADSTVSSDAAGAVCEGVDMACSYPKNVGSGTAVPGTFYPGRKGQITQGEETLSDRKRQGCLSVQVWVPERKFKSQPKRRQSNWEPDTQYGLGGMPHGQTGLSQTAHRIDPGRRDWNNGSCRAGKHFAVPETPCGLLYLAWLGTGCTNLARCSVSLTSPHKSRPSPPLWFSFCLLFCPAHPQLFYFSALSKLTNTGPKCGRNTKRIPQN